MSQLRVSVFLLLLFWLGCAFLGQLGMSLDPQHVAMRPFVFLLLAASVMLTLIVPAFRRRSGLILLVTTLAIYVIGRLTVFDAYPLVGGYHTYLSFSEAALLVVGAVLAQRLSRSVDHVERTVALLCLDGNSGRVRPLHRAEEEIDRAMVVARRHERQLSLVLIEAELPAAHDARDRTVALSLRLGDLVRHLDGSLRRQELILTAPFERRVALVLSDTDAAGASGIRTHVGGLQARIELDLRMSVAVFPANGLTFGELMSHAAEQLTDKVQGVDHLGPAQDDRQLEAG